MLVYHSMTGMVEITHFHTVVTREPPPPHLAGDFDPGITRQMAFVLEAYIAVFTLEHAF
jgi:hypothetical protein